MSNGHRRHKWPKHQRHLESWSGGPHSALRPQLIPNYSVPMTCGGVSSGRRGTARLDSAQGGRQEGKARRVRNWPWTLVKSLEPGGLPDRNTGQTTSGLPKSRNPTACKIILLHLSILASNWYPSRKHFKYLQRKTRVYLREVNSQIQGVHVKAVQTKPEADNSPLSFCDHPIGGLAPGLPPPQSHHAGASRGQPKLTNGQAEGHAHGFFPCSHSDHTGLQVTERILL